MCIRDRVSSARGTCSHELQAVLSTPVLGCLNSDAVMKARGLNTHYTRLIFEGGIDIYYGGVEGNYYCHCCVLLFHVCYIFARQISDVSWFVTGMICDEL